MVQMTNDNTEKQLVEFHRQEYFPSIRQRLLESEEFQTLAKRRPLAPTITDTSTIRQGMKALRKAERIRGYRY